MKENGKKWESKNYTHTHTKKNILNTSLLIHTNSNKESKFVIIFKQFFFNKLYK